MTLDCGASVRSTLPFDHPVVTEAMGQASLASADDARTLAAEGHEIRLAWLDPIPEFIHGEGPKPGRVFVDSYFQSRNVTPVEGQQSGTFFATLRTHTLTTHDGITLTLPVWRWGRRDIPCKTACDKACAECGTGDYWLLPEYIRPAPSVGLSDPEDPTRLDGSIVLLYALGTKPLKVVATDHARYAWGSIGRPQPVRVARLMRYIRKDHKDLLVIKWRNGGEQIVDPRDVMLKEDSPLYSPASVSASVEESRPDVRA